MRRPVRLQQARLRAGRRLSAGAATLIEFVFAPPAIALAIGAYLNVQFPALDPGWRRWAYLCLMTLNIVGVQIAATFELFVTLLAIFELLVFMGVAPGFSLANFTKGGWSGSDGFSLAACRACSRRSRLRSGSSWPSKAWPWRPRRPRTQALHSHRLHHRHPDAGGAGHRRDAFAGGAGDWTKLSNINDPLPQAMKLIVGDNSNRLHMLVWLGLFGLVASFHGIILGYSRQIFALAREGYLPAYFARVHPRFKTPHRAILAGGVVGIAAIYSDELIKIGGQTLTANIVTMSVFGAILMYILSMLSLFRLRRAEAGLERPFRAPLYPYFPAFALFGALVCMATMIYYNPLIFGIFVALLALGYAWFLATARQRAEGAAAVAEF
jgi:ethanolamine permease